MTGFVVSIYSCVYRPFAPCRSPAGETFELVAPDKGIRALGEKVSCELLKAGVPLRHRRMACGWIAAAVGAPPLLTKSLIQRAEVDSLGAKASSWTRDGRPLQCLQLCSCSTLI